MCSFICEWVSDSEWDGTRRSQVEQQTVPSAGQKENTFCYRKVEVCCWIVVFVLVACIMDITKQFQNTFAISNIFFLLMFIGPCIIVIVVEWKTNLMSLAVLFQFLCAQHVSDINISIESNVYWTVHHCNSWRMKDQLDVTCCFISILMCSACFGL